MAKTINVDNIELLIPQISFGQRREIENALHTITVKNRVIQNTIKQLSTLLDNETTDTDVVDKLIESINKYRNDIVTIASAAIANTVKKIDNSKIDAKYVSDNISTTNLVTILLDIVDENTLSEDKKK